MVIAVGQIAAIARVAIELLSGDSLILLGLPHLAKLFEAGQFAWPFNQIGLSELIHSGTLAQVCVAGVIHAERHIAYLYLLIAYGSSHAHSYGIDLSHRADVSTQIDPTGEAGLVVGGSHVDGRSRRLGIIDKGNGQTIPLAWHVGMNAHLVVTM